MTSIPMLAVGALVLTSALLRGQYDPNAPEPINPLRGSVLLVSGQVTNAVRTRFFELAGNPNVISVLSADPKAPPPFDEYRTTRFSAPLSDVSARALGFSDGVWLAGDDPDEFIELYRGTAVEAALRDVIARGGVVGASGAMATVVTAARREGQPGLDLLPGSVVEVDFFNTRDQLIEFLETNLGLVGFGIEEGSALIVERRSVTALGNAVYVSIAGAPPNGPTMEVLGGRRRGDLLAFSRAAVARTLDPFPPENPSPPGLDNGSLMILGGGSLPPGMLQRFIELCGGPNAPIVYVPCTPAETIPKTPRFVTALRRAGARNVIWVHTKSRHLSDQDDSILAPLRQARGIWFGGGRQWNLVDSYADTTAHKLMHEVLERGGAIGGSSSGASILADYLARGHPVGNRQIMAEGYERGLGFLTGTAIDQHTTQRNRLPDLRSLKRTHPQLLGIGLDEGAGLIVRGSVAEVHALPGRQAFFFDLDRPAQEDDHKTLLSGQRYDLAERQVVPGNAAALPAPTDIVGRWNLAWITNSGRRTATLRLTLELEGSLLMGEDRLRLQDFRMDGGDLAFSLEGMPGDFEFAGHWEGAAMRGILLIDGEKIADFTGTKLDDGPSEYFDDARR